MKGPWLNATWSIALAAAKEKKKGKKTKTKKTKGKKRNTQAAVAHRQHKSAEATQRIHYNASPSYHYTVGQVDPQCGHQYKTDRFSLLFFRFNVFCKRKTNITPNHHN